MQRRFSIGNTRIACSVLIETSRKLIRESNVRITRTKATLAFSRRGEAVN